MKVSDLFRVKNPEIKALHLTWIAFFICFYVWFNMAPLASSMLRSEGWLTKDDIRLFAIANVALTIPALSPTPRRAHLRPIFLTRISTVCPPR